MIKRNVGFLVHFTDNKREGGSWMTRALREYVIPTGRFEDIAVRLGCFLGDEAWDVLSQRGPPYEPHDPKQPLAQFPAHQLDAVILHRLRLTIGLLGS